jgi:hypothetical protein
MKVKYNCLKRKLFVDGEFEIRPISVNDIEQIRFWRNMQIDVLRQKKIITSSEQIVYFNTVLLPLLTQEFPDQIIFSYFKNNILIGYGGLVHLSWEDKRAELSFLLNPEFVKIENLYEEYFLKFINFMKVVNFNQLQFHKIFTETFSNRTFHISVLEKAGFEIEGVLRDHIIINEAYNNSLIHSIIKDV